MLTDRDREVILEALHTAPTSRHTSVAERNRAALNLQAGDPVGQAIADLQKSQLEASVAALTQLRSLVRTLCEELGGMLVLLEEAVGEQGAESIRGTRDWLMKVKRLDGDLGDLLAEIAS